MSRYQLDAYSALEGVRRELGAFLRSSFRFCDERLDAAVHQAIDRHGILAPPVAEATFPYEEPTDGPRTLADLTAGAQPLLHSALADLLENAAGDARWPRTRPLYRHQIEALRAYREGNSLVVASGTGSGKTECFLLPAIDTVLRDSDLAQPGIRVLLVYPLNALVNNQMDRLRAILGHHKDIRFALYTRRLAYSEAEAQRKLRNAGRQIYPAEVISREALRARPPHIVVTNFSMLEYALVRPADAGLFAQNCVRPRLVVLDEAHVYAGSLAAEITLLLRRTWLRWGIEEAIQGIITSATMHQGEDAGADKLRRFSADLLSQPVDRVRVIEGGRVMPADQGTAIKRSLPSSEAIVSLNLDFPTLKDVAKVGPSGDVEHHVEFDDEAAGTASARDIIRVFGRDDVAEQKGPAAHLLWRAFQSLDWLRELRTQLHGNRAQSLHVLARRLFPRDDELLGIRATYRILALLSLARETPSGLPLMPVRLHAVARGPHGIYACINGACATAAVPGRLGALYPDPVSACACGGMACEVRVCESCGQSFLTADTGEDDEGVAALKTQGCKKVDLYVPGMTWDDGRSIEGARKVRVYANGRIAHGTEGIEFSCFTGGRVFGATKRLLALECPRCGVSLPNGSILRRIEAGTDAELQVIIDGLYPSLPEHPGTHGGTLRGGGRRALLFADNRQIAAALAAKVEESHDVLLARSILLRSLKEGLQQAVSPEVERLQTQQLQALQRGEMSEVERLVKLMGEQMRLPVASSVGFRDLARAVADNEELEQISTFEPERREGLARLIVARELGRRPARVGNLEASGLVAIEYPANIPQPSHPDVATAFVEDWSSLVHVLLDILRTSGIVGLPDLPSAFHEYLLMDVYNRLLIHSVKKGQGGGEEDDDDDRVKKVGLIPHVTGRNRCLDYVERVLERRSSAPTVTARLVLEQVWEALVTAARSGNGCLRLAQDQQEPALRMPMEFLRFRQGSGRPLWRCESCKTIWARLVSSVCPARNCRGTLAPIAEPDPRDRLAVLAKSREPLLGLSTEEHTAQIGTLHLEDAEQAFKAGKVNVLVCSTTMELGIDIGGLSATVLTNVPPGPSNYLQRAGRAGRRAEGTSLVLTFARPRPFDQAAFEEPDRPFRDKITPPRVRLDSQRIVQRHVNAFLLSYFFRRHQAQEGGVCDPMSALRNVGEFFDRTIATVLAGSPNLQELGVSPSEATLSDAFFSWLLRAAVGDPKVINGVRALTIGTVLESRALTSICEGAANQVSRITTNVRDQFTLLRDEQERELAKPHEQQDAGMVAAIDLQKEELASEKLLGFLAEEQFLPRYGFPVQVVSLHHSWERRPRGGRATEEDDSELRLSRDIALALNEYAPGAEIVAGKHVHRSSGIVRHWTGSDAPGLFSSRFIGLCSQCGGLQYGRTSAELRDPCPTCGEGSPRRIPVLHPKLGFAVRWGIRPRRWTAGIKPPLKPVTESAYAARDGSSVVDVSPGLALAYDEEGQILVRTEGELDMTELPGSGSSYQETGTPRAGYGYAICYLCGRAEPETDSGSAERDPLPSAIQGHHRLRGYRKCEATNHYWRHVALAGAVRTETLCFQLKGPLQLPPGVTGRQLATTWLVALQLSAGQLLWIDSRSIGGLLVPRDTQAGVVFDALLYDQLAGGAGHCRTLLDRWDELVELTKNRLACANPRCANGCHRCLIAFETQRYEDMLRRAALLAFLDERWAVLKERPVRDGFPVGALFRGRSDVLDRVARATTTCITVLVPAIAPDALEDDGWLRPLLRHSDGAGKLRIGVERLPDPNDDGERFVAARLRSALLGGRVMLYAMKKDSAAAFHWRILFTDPVKAFYLEGDAEDGLGPKWLADAGGVYAAQDEAAAKTLAERAEALIQGSRRAASADLEPDPPAATVVVSNVAAGLPAARATFEAWLRGPSGDSLFAQALTELVIIDPYLQTDWQLRLLSEVVSLAKRAKCRTVRVDTYAPKVNASGYGPRTVTAEEQRRFISECIGNPKWRPLPPPIRNVERLHKRTIRGTREDGTRFEVLLERGLDFMVERGRGDRSTRETYLVIRDPA